MSFISYAQNFEDVMLWRCFKTLENGFYIDVGAAWPRADNVTYAFYERGWRGINIEANPRLCVELNQERPRDITLNCLAGAENSHKEIALLDNAGLSTAVDEHVERHTAQGAKIIAKHALPLRTLTDICVENIPVGQSIQFLKIDVEGMEADVIKGLDLQRFRPWIVVVESTLPMSTEISRGQWDHMLINAGYQFVYFDGLNDFYLANEHQDLQQHFTLPPNFFDHFVKHDWLQYSQAVDALKLQTTTLQQRLEQLAETQYQQSELIHDQHKEILQHQNELAARIIQSSEGKNHRDYLTKLVAQYCEDMSAKYIALKESFEQIVAKQHAVLEETLKRELHDGHNSLRDAVQHSDTKLQEWRQAIQSQLESYFTKTNWQLIGKDYVRFLKSFAKKAIQFMFRPWVVWAMKYVLARPRLKNYALRQLTRFPRLKNKLRHMAAVLGLAGDYTPQSETKFERQTTNQSVIINRTDHTVVRLQTSFDDTTIQSVRRKLAK